MVIDFIFSISFVKRWQELVLGSRLNKQQVKCPHLWILDECFMACMPNNLELEVKEQEGLMTHATLNIENNRTPN